ncbi:maintenance of telomere capping protein 1 [Pseudomassariella vexata]|uniref:Maintenance of telomere capping protein 1 n=1 Tax=Pseudomassariella vexata TaxID=1141098 RepID=A0A1Y2DEX7_9PEZI|nr:maintenance of telomere capping protein 1 [Pseudomassariella vexata]ORY57818.1 maintenance of telomere capping protein 1 [Pseudomassariella vexata]
MAAKNTKAAPTDDELGELFSGIGNDSGPKKTTKAKSAAAKARGEQPEDILAELENQLETQPARPHTPRIKDAASKRTSTATPPPAAGRLSEDKPNLPRKSADSTRSFHASFTPSATSSDLQDAEKRGPVEQAADAQAAASGGGWWGGIFATATATASAAVKQAEAAYKELQQNEEAKKYLESVRGNVGAIKGLGDELRHRALPTFTNILHTLAPPISSHERLLIHITHDLVGYPSLDPLIHEVFSRVMSQVEGGDLLVIQRGHESSARRASDATAFYTGSSSSAGWRDGPWWRQVDTPRDLGVVKGLVEGTKLCRVSAESYSTDYFAASGGVEEAQKRALEPVSEDNPVRTSDIFLAVQAILVDADTALFAGSTTSEKEKEESVVAEDNTDTQVCFAVYVLDPIHEIMYSSVSQSIPAKWIRWLDAPSPLTPASAESEGQQERLHDVMSVPEEIREIVEGGGVDPREWVAEWVEESLNLSVGVVAQRYVARRMGVGEGGFGKGKQKIEAVLHDGGGEAARAGLI